MQQPSARLIVQAAEEGEDDFGFFIIPFAVAVILILALSL